VTAAPGLLSAQPLSVNPRRRRRLHLGSAMLTALALALPLAVGVATLWR
jgi:hypothetical protein